MDETIEYTKKCRIEAQFFKQPNIYDFSYQNILFLTNLIH